MSSIIRHVKDLSAPDRQALEHVIGAPLGESAQVVIQVISNESEPRAEVMISGEARVESQPPWSTIYQGLNEQEVDRLDEEIRRRADLTRMFG